MTVNNKKSAGQIRRIICTRCRSAAGEEINNYKKYDHRERADHENVTHIVPGDADARFGRAFNDVIVFHPRHLIAPLTATRRRSGNNAEARGDVPHA
jgi:hypothetical protein